MIIIKQILRNRLTINQKKLRLLITVGLFVAILVVFSSLNEGFLTASSIISLLRETAVLGIIVVGMTFVIISGGIDISVGSIVAFTAMFCANLLRYSSTNYILAILISLVIALLCGIFNGVVITQLKLPDFIVSLATMNIYRGLTKTISHNDLESLSNSLIKNSSFKVLSQQFAGLYWVVWAFLLITIIGYLVLNYTKYGLYVFSVGSDRDSARLSGIKVKRIKQIAYSISGLLSGIAAIFLTARMMTATTETGTGLEFNAIAAVVIGGTSLNGGRGSIVGSFLGALMITVINSGITQMGLASSYQYIIKGCIILAAMMFDDWFFRHFSNRVLRRNKNGSEANIKPTQA